MADSAEGIPALTAQLKVVARFMRTALLQRTRVAQYYKMLPVTKDMIVQKGCENDLSFLEATMLCSDRAKELPNREFSRFVQYCIWSAWLESVEEDEKAATGGDGAVRSHTKKERCTVEEHDYGWALHQLFDGKALARRGWNGPNQYVKLQRPDVNSFMTLPYIYIRTAQNERVPWLCSQGDALAFDWYEVTDEAFPTAEHLVGGGTAGEKEKSAEEPATSAFAPHDGGKSEGPGQDTAAPERPATSDDAKTEDTPPAQQPTEP